MWKYFPATLLILGLVLTASCSTPGSNSGEPTALPVKDDFADCSTGWSTDKDEFVSLSCTDGAYRVLIKNPQKPQSVRIFLSKGATSLSVAADANLVAASRTTLYGVGCWASREQGYIFGVSPVAAWAIVKWNDGATPPQTVLAESDTENAIALFSNVNRIRAECVGGGQKPTTLALYVNGKKIGTAEDRDGLTSFPGFGFSVFATLSGTDVRFDNLIARELTATEVQSSQAAPTTSPYKLCDKDGIRYAGTTAEGAEVCFTLTPDRSAWVEIGFTFVKASGCPLNGAEEEDVRIPVPPTPLSDHGRIEIPASFAPASFTATIRGGKASGMFANSEICPGKTFEWTASVQP